MKIDATHNREGGAFILKYEQAEWDILEAKFKELGLEKAKTAKGLGTEQTYDYYRVEKGKDYWLDTVRLKLSSRGFQQSQLVDDINSAVMQSHAFFNIAVFRIIPVANEKTKNMEVLLPVDFFISKGDFLNFVDVSKDVFSFVLNDMNDMTASITFKSRTPDMKDVPADKAYAKKSDIEYVLSSDPSEVSAEITW